MKLLKLLIENLREGDVIYTETNTHRVLGITKEPKALLHLMNKPMRTQLIIQMSDISKVISLHRFSNNGDISTEYRWHDDGEIWMIIDFDKKNNKRIRTREWYDNGVVMRDSKRFGDEIFNRDGTAMDLT